jgi:hypothetical protein
MKYFRPTLYVTLLASLIAFQPAVQAKMYRWIDKDGHIYYSDKVPPKQSKLERNVLNDSGRVVETVKAAKTQEQIELEKRLAILRAEQEKIIAKQKSIDKVLLSTFRNVDDLRLTLNGKLVAVDAQKRVYVKNKEFLLEDLARLHKRAAQSERRGKKVPVSILDQMAQIEKNIQAADLDIGRAVQQREGIEKSLIKKLCVCNHSAHFFDFHHGSVF